jgi:hypothetical protein
LIRRERKRRDHSYIRRLIKNNKSTSIKVIQIPNPDDDSVWDEISDPTDIESHLIDKSIGHFSQANNTAFCQPPLVDIFDYEGTNQNMVQLVKQGLIPMEIRRQPVYIDLLLKKLANGENLPEINKDILFEDVRQAYIKWNERTTTSPSGRHLGHYKILTRLKALDEDDETINLSMELLKLYYLVSMTANVGKILVHV